MDSKNSRSRALTTKNSSRRANNADLKIRGFSQGGKRNERHNRNEFSSISSQKSRLSHKPVHTQNGEDPFEPFALFDFDYYQVKGENVSQDSDEKYKDDSPLTRISK